MIKFRVHTTGVREQSLIFGESGGPRTLSLTLLKLLRKKRKKETRMVGKAGRKGKEDPGGTDLCDTTLVLRGWGVRKDDFLNLPIEKKQEYQGGRVEGVERWRNEEGLREALIASAS